MHGMPPHIAQLVAGHRDINTTMGYKAVYPEEVINGHRAFIARRRELRPSEEYRTPTDVIRGSNSQESDILQVAAVADASVTAMAGRSASIYGGAPGSLAAI